jgi:hypothetical protein
LSSENNSSTFTFSALASFSAAAIDGVFSPRSTFDR